MLNITNVTARDILRNYKEVFDKVKKTKQPAVVMSQKEPQVAIVPMEDLEKLNVLAQKQSARGLIKIAELAEKLQVKGPSDLSANMDEYLWNDYDN